MDFYKILKELELNLKNQKQICKINIILKFLIIIIIVKLNTRPHIDKEVFEEKSSIFLY